jgi:Phage gp6-like head-tail connector protein
MHSILEILEESSASAGPDLISLADLKLALGITDASEDAILQAAITHQSRIIAEYCDRRFGLAEVSETFTFDPGEYLSARQGLVLQLYPVAEVHEVSTLGASAGGYHFDPASGRLWMNGVGFLAGESISVVYTGGYDLPEQSPARLQQAIILAVNEGRTSGTRDPSIREVQHGDTRISYFTSATSSASPGYLSAPVIDLIRPYRRLSVA